MNELEKKGWKRIITIIILVFVGTLVVLVYVLPFFVGSNTAASTKPVHIPGEIITVDLPSANGGLTNAEVMLLGNYKSMSGEDNRGYSWYYNVTIKDVGDGAILLKYTQYATDKYGVPADISIPSGYIQLYPNQKHTIVDKIMLLKRKETPTGGGTYTLVFDFSNGVRKTAIFQIPEE